MADTSLKDLDNRLEQTQKDFHEHAITVNQTFQKEFSRLETVTAKFEELMNDGLKNQAEKVA